MAAAANYYLRAVFFSRLKREKNLFSDLRLEGGLSC